MYLVLFSSSLLIRKIRWLKSPQTGFWRTGAATASSRELNMHSLTRKQCLRMSDLQACLDRRWCLMTIRFILQVSPRFCGQLLEWSSRSVSQWAQSGAICVSWFNPYPTINRSTKIELVQDRKPINLWVATASGSTVGIHLEYKQLRAFPMYACKFL